MDVYMWKNSLLLHKDNHAMIVIDSFNIRSFSIIYSSVQFSEWSIYYNILLVIELSFEFKPFKYLKPVMFNVYLFFCYITQILVSVRVS